MKRNYTILNAVIVFCMFFTTVELDARGRGGGRGGGVQRGGGRAVQRSPSMSQPLRNYPQAPRSQRVSGPQQKSGPRHQTPRPQSWNAQPGQGNRGQTRTRDEVQQHLKSRPATPSGYSPEQRREKRQIQGQESRSVDIPRKEFDVRRQDRPYTDRHDIGKKVRHQVQKDRPGHKYWFNDDFWRKHHHRPPYYRYHYPNYWWRWATVGGIGLWLGWNAAPIYYGYDDQYWEEYEYYGTPQGYSQQTQKIEDVADEATSEEWMPLGVFAFTNTGESSTTPNIYMQLAINKDGMISGTYYNTIADATFEIEGMVDEESQRAAWKVVDSENAPIMETGIYNLTKSEVPVRMIYVDGGSQEMMLVRLEEPEGEENEAR